MEMSMNKIGKFLANAWGGTVSIKFVQGRKAASIQPGRGQCLGMEVNIRNPCIPLISSFSA